MFGVTGRAEVTETQDSARLFYDKKIFVGFGEDLRPGTTTFLWIEGIEVGRGDFRTICSLPATNMNEPDAGCVIDCGETDEH